MATSDQNKTTTHYVSTSCPNYLDLLITIINLSMLEIFQNYCISWNINFSLAESLIDDINMDISQASKSLEENEFKTFAQDSYFNLNLQNGHL